MQCNANEELMKETNEMFDQRQSQMKSDYADVMAIHNYAVTEDPIMPKIKDLNKLYWEYQRQKEEFTLGNRPKDILDEFIKDEMTEYKGGKGNNAVMYDAIIQKYTSNFNVSKRKKKTMNLHIK